MEMTRERLNEIRARLTSVDNEFDPLESFELDVLDLLAAAERLIAAKEAEKMVLLSGFGRSIDGAWICAGASFNECARDSGKLFTRTVMDLERL
jgi:hypothetical protein